MQEMWPLWPCHPALTLMAALASCSCALCPAGMNLLMLLAQSLSLLDDCDGESRKLMPSAASLASLTTARSRPAGQAYGLLDPVGWHYWD